MSKPSTPNPKNPPSGGVWRVENGRLVKAGTKPPKPATDKPESNHTKPRRTFGKGAKSSKED